eukprot:jgi/Mesvir1/2960/Mv09586-RA.1
MKIRPLSVHETRIVPVYYNSARETYVSEREELEPRKTNVDLPIAAYVNEKSISQVAKELFSGNSPADVITRNRLRLAIEWADALTNPGSKLFIKDAAMKRDVAARPIPLSKRYFSEQKVLKHDEVKELIPAEARSALLDPDINRLLKIRAMLADRSNMLTALGYINVGEGKWGRLHGMARHESGREMTPLSIQYTKKQLEDLERSIKEEMGRAIVSKMTKRMDVIDNSLESVQSRIQDEMTQPEEKRNKTRLDRLRRQEAELLLQEKDEIAHQKRMWEARAPVHIPQLASYLTHGRESEKMRDRKVDTYKVINEDLGLLQKKPKQKARGPMPTRRSGRTQHVPGEMFDFEEAGRKAERKAAKKKGSDGAGPSHQVKARRYRKRRAATRR